MEVLIVDAEVERRVAAGETTDRIVEAARQGGMRSMWDSGMDHVLSGATDLEEILRVVEVPMEQSAGRVAPRVEHRLFSPSPTGIAAIAPPEIPAVVPVAPPPPRVAPRAPASVFLPGEVLELLDDQFTSGGRKGARHTILLVEDEHPLRTVMRDLLERDGFTIVEAEDGIEALDAIDRHAPDAVVLDLNLPRLDGYAVLARLRARPLTAHLPVIVLTAKGDEDNEVRVFEGGANDFLTKPFRPRALSARLRALLRQG